MGALIDDAPVPCAPFSPSIPFLMVQHVSQQNMKLQQNMENMQTSQARLLDKLIACCKEPSGERSQRLFSFLREELQKRGTKIADETPPPEGQPASGV